MDPVTWAELLETMVETGIEGSPNRRPVAPAIDDDETLA